MESKQQSDDLVQKRVVNSSSDELCALGECSVYNHVLNHSGLTKRLNLDSVNNSVTQIKNNNTNTDKAPNIDCTEAFDTIVSPACYDNSWKADCVPINVSNDKYANTVLHKNCATKFLQCDQEHCDVFNLWKSQSKYNLGFVPLSDLIMPESTLSGKEIGCPIHQHFHVRISNLPNFMGQHTPVVSAVAVANTIWLPIGL